ncbi:putative lipid II flippase FtsW [candidate division KSB1 bacterium]|nr:putative lipid II flippase FtsW [candidate division KSB1 bacterium]
MTHPLKFDYLLLITVLLITVIGVSIVFSASSFKAKERYGDSSFYLKKQLVRVFIGLALMLVFFYIDYHDLQKLSWLMLLISLVLLIYVFINGARLNGSRRSFNLMGFMFQPSEAAKYSLILFISDYLARRQKEIKEFANGLLPALIVTGVLLLPILLEPDLGTSILILVIAGILLFVGGANLWHLFSIGALGLGTAAMLISSIAYQKSRFFQFVDAVRGMREPPWQVVQSLICFANGGFWGVGLGNSRQKYHFLPQPFTDFIYSILAEELGLIGAVFVLLLFMVLLWRGISIALNAPDSQGRFLAIGITSAILLYAFTSIAIVTNLFPITGIPLPFISYGGSAMMMNFMAVGILLNISSQCFGKPAAVKIRVTHQKRNYSKYRVNKNRARRK